MKKVIILAVVLAVTIAAVVAIFVLQKQTNPKPSDVGEFSLSKYEWQIETFPSDKNVGKVNDASVAVEKAKALWLEKYSTVAGKPYNPIKEGKIDVSYDSEEECWHVNCEMRPNKVGGVPHAIIRKNGAVLAVWIDD